MTEPSPGGQVLFTLAEANALLPALIPVLTTLRDQKTAFDEARRSLGRLSPTMRGNGHGAQAAELEATLTRLAEAMSAGVRQIVAQGVEVKDLDLGLIDFPSLRDGRVVYLCWRLGEESIAYWHDLSAGFAGRQPL